MCVCVCSREREIERESRSQTGRRPCSERRSRAMREQIERLSGLSPGSQGLTVLRVPYLLDIGMLYAPTSYAVPVPDLRATRNCEALGQPDQDEPASG